MEMIARDRRAEIDVGKMVVEIDDIFHREVSSKTGVLIGHNAIVRFIAGFIVEHNKRELRIQYEEQREIEEVERICDEIKRKVASGKVVSDLDSWSNRIKHYFLGYIWTNGEEGDKDGND